MKAPAAGCSYSTSHQPRLLAATLLSKHGGVVHILVSPIRHLNRCFNEHSLPPKIRSLFSAFPPPAQPALRHTSMLATQHVFSVERTRSQSSLEVLRSPGVWATCQDV